MSDVYGRRLEDRVEWSIPLPNYADQIYKLIGRMETEAEEHGIDTSYGDWFQVRTDELDEAVGSENVLLSRGRKLKLTLWFYLPGHEPTIEHAD